MRWTQDKDEVIRALYPSTLASTIAQMLGSTERAVRQRASSLGVRRVRGAGRPPTNWKPIGTERWETDKEVMLRKVTDTGNPKKDWKRVDVIEWEAVHGPILPGHLLMVINSSLPRTLDNLALFTPEQHFARISVHSMSKEVAELYQIKGQITKALKERQKSETPA